LNSDSDNKSLAFEFLLKEYEKAWDMIYHIEERRFKIIQYYSFISAGVLAIVTKFLLDGPDTLVESARGHGISGIVISLLLFMTLIIGGVFIRILLSERAANMRYRG